MAGGEQGVMLVLLWRFPVFSETFATDHIRAMTARGWRVVVCCVERDDAALADQSDLGLDRIVVLGSAAHPGPLRRLRRLTATGEVTAARSAIVRHASNVGMALRPHLPDLAPDLIYGQFGANAAAAVLATGADGPPVIADFHGFDITSGTRGEGWRAYRRLLRGRPLVVHSRFAADLVRQGLGSEPAVVEYGFADDFHAPRRAASWPTPLRLLFVGRLIAAKGVDIAIRAVTDLADRRPELEPHLTVVGDGPLRLDKGDAVEWVGRQRPGDVARLMREHDILLVPSRPTSDGWVEAFGRVAAEGIASGMAVVASDTGGLPEAVGDAGVVVPPDDPSAVVQAIEALVDASDPAAILARTQASPRPSFADMAAAYDLVAQRAVAGGPLPESDGS